MQIQIVVNVHQDGATAGWEGWQAHRECFQCIIDHTSERGTAQLQKQKWQRHMKWRFCDVGRQWTKAKTHVETDWLSESPGCYFGNGAWQINGQGVSRSSEEEIDAEEVWSAC